MFSEPAIDHSEQVRSSNLAIQANNLSKCYRIYDHPRDRLIQALWGRDRLGRPKQRYREFWALDDVSFELERGKTLGVVGRNGSGKSTLLQILCGTLQATTGMVKTRGRIGALLELGSGFNPEFSGLDNVFLNASLLGLSQAETEQQLEAILSFADIGDFIHQPVKTYSSGMAVRLAFAVQAHINPDVLVVDEALAVGDELFQKKCYAHLERLKAKGTAVLLVTHNCPQIIQHCDQALLLQRGKMRMLDRPARVTTTYQRFINADDAEWDKYFTTNKHVIPLSTNENSHESEGNNSITTKSISNIQAHKNGWMDHKLISKTFEEYDSQGGMITDAWIITKSERPREKNNQVNHFKFGLDFTINFEYEAETDLRNVAMACNIASVNGQRITGQCHPKSAGIKKDGCIDCISKGTRWLASFKFRGGLWPGLYFFGGSLLSYTNNERTIIHRVIDYKILRILETETSHTIGACAMASENAEIQILTKSSRKAYE